MQLSIDEANLLFDPRYPSGYWHVYKTPNRFFVAFSHANKRVVKRKFRTGIAAASWIANYFCSRHGVNWVDWVFPERSGHVRGAGWQIKKIADGEYVLDVCPCGEWCRVEHKVKGRRTDIFTSEKKAKRALNMLSRFVWPLYGNRIIDPVPYYPPRRVVFLSAKVD